MARPTLLIGYGSYGHIILRDLLKSSSMRGLLKWNANVGLGQARCLENLRIFYINDIGLNEQQAKKQDSPIYTDLFNQINEIKYDRQTSDNSLNFLNIISSAVKEIRGVNQNQGVDALDVFFIARPDEIPGTLTHLDGVMRKLIEQLNGDMPKVKDQVQNSETLNFIEFLDYDVLNGNQDLQRSLESWEKTRINRGSSNAYGRVYVCEEATQQGLRPYRLRQKEVVLFLEFLLFENNQQKDEFSKFYKSVENEPILSAFGIRLAERNIEQLSRSVAIDFAKGWLSYIIGSKNTEAKPTVVPVLQKLNISELLEQIEWDAIENGIVIKTQKIVNTIAQKNNISAVDNIDQLLDEIRRIETDAAHQVSAKLSEFREKQLKNIKDDLYKAISFDLCHAEKCVTLHDLKQKIQAQIDKMKTSHPMSENREESDQIESKIRAYYENYAQFINQSIDIQKNAYVCWIFALLLAMAFTPGLYTVIQQLEPSNLFPNISLSSEVINFYNNYLISKQTSFVMAFLFIGLPFRWLVAKFIRNHNKNSIDWFIHKDKGRLIHALRLAERKEIFSSMFHQEIQHSLTTEVQQTLIDIKTLLGQRHKEIAWLIAKLNDTKFALESDEDDNIFYNFLQKNGDKEAIKKHLPTTIERYKGKISEAPEIFKDWDAEYNNICLNPLEFIDHLSKNCKNAYYHENEEEKEVFVDFLHGVVQHFCVGVDFHQQPGDLRYALISNNLKNQAITEKLHQDLNINNVVYSETMKNKIYLLIIKHGINSTVLSKASL